VSAVFALAWAVAEGPFPAPNNVLLQSCPALFSLRPAMPSYVRAIVILFFTLYSSAGG